MEEPEGDQGCINRDSEASPGRKIRLESPTGDMGHSAPGTGTGGAGQLVRLRAGWRGFTKGTIFSSIFTLLTTCIGAGTLSLPLAFEQGGLIPSAIIFFLIMVVSVMVGFMLFAAKRYCEELYPGMAVWGYEDIALVAFGPVGKIVVLLTLIVLLFLSLIAYMIYTRDQLDLVVQFALSKAGHVPACSPLVNCAVLMSIAFLPLFPITLIRNLTPMQFTSTFSMMCISYVGITMFIKMIIFQNENHDTQDINFGPRGFKGLIVTVTYCSLSFVCHFNLLPLQKELQRPTKRRMSIIVIGSMVMAYCLYNLIIFSGYFRFFGDLKDDVMLNYPRTDILMTTARVAIFFTLLCSYPVLLHPTRAAINRLVIYTFDIVTGCGKCGVRGEEGRGVRGEGVNTREGVKGGERWEEEEEGEEEDVDVDEKVPLIQKKARAASDVKIPLPVWISETWMLFAITFTCASFIPNVGLVWNFVGSIGGTLVLYIFPPAFFLRLRYMRYRQRKREVGTGMWAQHDWFAVVRETVATVIMITGCLLLVAENYSAVEAILSQPHVPSSLCYQSKCNSDPSIANASSFQTWAITDHH